MCPDTPAGGGCTHGRFDSSQPGSAALTAPVRPCASRGQHRGGEGEGRRRGGRRLTEQAGTHRSWPCTRWLEASRSPCTCARWRSSPRRTLRPSRFSPAAAAARPQRPAPAPPLRAPSAGRAGPGRAGAGRERARSLLSAAPAAAPSPPCAIMQRYPFFSCFF